jgi:hypothetical protein
VYTRLSQEFGFLRLCTLRHHVCHQIVIVWMESLSSLVPMIVSAPMGFQFQNESPINSQTRCFQCISILLWEKIVPDSVTISAITSVKKKPLELIH